MTLLTSLASLWSVAAIPTYLLDEGFTGRVEITETRMGRGLAAASDFLPGDEVLSVPLRHIVSLDTLDTVTSLSNFSLPESLLALEMPDVLASILAASRHSETFISKLLPQEPSHPLTVFGPEDWEFAESPLYCAFATQSLLNDNAWPLFDAEEEMLKDADVLSRSMYQAVDDLDVCPTAAALQRERDWELNEPIASCPGWMGGQGLVDELYESHPYPSWRRFGSLRNAERTKIRRSLIAGAGTGKAVLAHLEHYAPQEILAVDFSKRSLQMAKRQLLALSVTNVTFLHCDLTILERTSLGTFDVIESIGVLHHLADPSVGFAALRRLLAPKGVLVLGLYSRVARRSLPVMRQLAAQAEQAAQSKEQFRDWLVQGAIV
eukprot:Skav218298  [mRNA]  locus=scaffold2388:115018:119087:+ [translate_table: standard]